MKKLFLLIPALVLAVITNAAAIQPGTGTLATAIDAAEPDAVIELATGVFVENSPIGLTKNITIKAANGAVPVIKAKGFGIQEGAQVVFKGIKFDASLATSHLIYANDATAGNKLTLKDCELYDFTPTSSLIHCGSSEKIDACVIDNCYFHNIKKNCFFNENDTDESNLTVTNSTFANITTADSYYAGVIDTRATSGTFLVDHCTFYNVEVINTDYAAVGKVSTPNAVVSNCIFKMQESTANLRAIRDVKYANNCLVYNYTKDSNWGIHSDVTKNNCIQGQDPLFADATNANFTLSSTSPAVMASDNWTPLGAKEWWPTLTYPSVDFTTPYTLVNTNAKLVGNIALNANNHIVYSGLKLCGQAGWPIHVSNACAITAAVNMEEGSASGCTLQLIIFDANGNKVDSILAPYVENDEDFVIPGSMFFPAEGDYYIGLYNKTGWSSAKIEDITLSYVGGAAQSIPATIGVAEAWYSAKGSREDNMISFTSYTDNWAKWNIAVPGTGEQGYAVTLTISNLTEYGHRFYVSVYEEGDEEHAQTVGESSWNQTYDAENPLALSLGNIAIKGGKNYIVKVTNTAGGSKPKIISVDFASLGGAVQNMPGTTNINDAWFIGGTRASGKITFTPGHVNEGWAKWNVACTSAANYNVTLNINSGNGKKFTVALQDANGNDVVTPLYKNGGDEGTPVALEMGSMNVPVGSYILKVSNAEAWSDAELISVKFERQGGGLIDIPDELTFDEVILSQRAWIDNDSILFTARGDEGHNSSEYAKWNVHATGGWYTFTVNGFNSNANNENGQQYTISVLSGNESETLETKTSAWAHPGASSCTTDPVELAEGNYVVKVQNALWGSTGRVMSVSAAYEGGALVNIPNATIPFNESLLYNGATRDLSGDPQQIHFGSVDAYAQWNIHATTDGVYSFTYTVVGSDYGKYNLIIVDSQDNIIYDNYQGLSNSGSVTHSNILLDAGNYTIKVANVNSGSVGYITNVAATAAEGYFILNDNKTDDGSIAAADYDASNTTYNVLLKRSFTAGRYYTFCVPFDTYNSQLASKFGAEYELWRMVSAEQVGDVINLNFEKYDGSNFEPAAGTPFLLKPSVDVENPVFSGKKIRNYTYNNTKSFTAADFVGTFYKSEIPAGENNLYLQNNELFYNENNNTPIKGMRAWVRIKASSPGAAPKARIVLRENVTTDIDLVGGENETIKTIENGQLVIIRDGVRYNVMGTKIQ